MEWYEVVEQAMQGTKFENANGDKIEWDNELGFMCYLNDPRLYSLRLLKQHKWKPIEEVDWSNVQVDTPILVKEFEKDAWKKRHFAKYEDGKVYAWGGGCTSFSGKGVMRVWSIVKLADPNAFTITKERYDELIRAEEQIKNQKSAFAIEMERVNKELEKLSTKSVIDIQKYTRQNPCSTDELVAEIRDARMYIDDSQIDEVLDALGYIGLVEFNKVCRTVCLNRALPIKISESDYKCILGLARIIQSV